MLRERVHLYDLHVHRALFLAASLSFSLSPRLARADQEGGLGPTPPGPNMAEELILRTRAERAAEQARRLKIATYALTLTSVAAGTWAIASGVRGHQIDDTCAGEASCSHATAAHGRMLYRSADAGAALAAACGVSAVILLWRLLKVSPSDDWRSARAPTLQIVF